MGTISFTLVPFPLDRMRNDSRYLGFGVAVIQTVYKGRNLGNLRFAVPWGKQGAAVVACLVLAVLALWCSGVSAAEPSGAKSTARFTFEPTFGALYGASDTAHWQGGFAELTTWREERNRDKGFSFGLDTIATYSTGSVIDSTYKWEEERIGAGPAIQYSDNNVLDPWQWQLKVRLLHERVDGNNQESYRQRQESIILNPYTEYLLRLAPTWLAGLTAEGCLMLTASKSSTVAYGDEISDRNQAIVSVYVQHKLGRKIQGRVSVLGLYQGWDDKLGEELAAELRYNETMMCGLQGGLIGDSHVITVFVRVELAKLLRDNMGP